MNALKQYYKQMKKYYILKQICTLVLLILFIPCYGQVSGYMYRCSLKDKVGNLWFGTMGAGVYRYDATSGKFTNFTMQDGLNDNNIASVFEDKAGNLWFGTANGICRYDGKSFTNVTAKEGLGKFDINCILEEDGNGNFWFGTNGYGVCRYNPVTGAAINFTTEQGLGSNHVQRILEDKSGNLWFGERDGGVCRFDAAKGRFTKVDEYLSSQIMDIIEDKMGNIWFANLYDGLCRYNLVSNTFTHLTEEDGICGNVVTCIYEDKKGNLWFSCGVNRSGIIRAESKGLCRYDGKSFTLFTAKDGLADIDVWTIVEDNDGNMWVGTRDGLFRYHSPSGRFIDYTHKVKKQ